MSEAGNELVLMAGLVGGVPLLAATGLLRLLYRPRDPGQGEVVMDLGPESPALVDLLTDRFEVTAQAPVATLIDLAARRWVDIEEPVPDEVIVRLRAQPGHGELTSFEQRVLRRVGEVAGSGPAPAAALVKGEAGAAERWQRAFRNEVISVARAQGLCRARWPVFVQALAVAAAAVAALAFVFGAPDRDQQTTGTFDRVNALSLATAGLAVVAVVSAARMMRGGQVRGTELGLQRARSWLGVRRFMADHGRFEEYPAASVQIWDRYLAHAVALDLAPLAARQLPLGAESDRWAWSRYGGRWQLVKVRYPKLRPGWGRPPWRAIPIGMAVTVLGWWIGRPVGRVLFDLVSELPDEFPDQGWLVWLGRVAAAAVPVVIAAWVAVGPVQTLLALVDFATIHHVEGLVLRHRPGPTNSRNGQTVWYWVAVQTGPAERLRAYRVSGALAGGIQQGAMTRVKVTRLLGWVRELQPLPLTAVALSPTRSSVAGVGGVPENVWETEFRRRAGDLARQRSHP